MGKLIEKSVVVTLPAEEITRLERLVGAGAYGTLDDIVREAVHVWLGEHPPAKPKAEPVFELRGHVSDFIGRRFGQNAVSFSQSLESLGGVSSGLESGSSPVA